MNLCLSRPGTADGSVASLTTAPAGGGGQAESECPTEVAVRVAHDSHCNPEERNKGKAGIRN